MAYSITLTPVCPTGSTICSTLRGYPTSNSVNSPPNTFDKNNPSHTRSLALSQSFAPKALATSGAVIVGKNAAMKYIEKKH